MIVIVEGPDGAGKSTLARQVAEVSGATYFHAEPPVEGTSHVDVLRPEWLDEGDWVLDRWHVAEMIYGRIRRDRPALTWDEFHQVDDFLNERGAIHVLCNGTVAQLTRRILDRGKDEPPPKLRLEAKLYEEVSEISKLPLYRSPIAVPMTAGEVAELARVHDKFQGGTKCT